MADTYLRATSNALYSQSTTVGTAYVVELQNPTFTGPACSASLALVKMINGVVTVLYNTTVPCGTVTELRVVYSYGTIAAYVNSLLYILISDSSIASGQPGVGLNHVSANPAPAAGNAISAIDIAARYTGAPAPVDPQSVTASSFPNRADLKWTGAAEPNGPGIAWYQIFRTPQGGSQSWLANLNNNTTMKTPP